MNETQIQTMLQNPELTPARRAALEAKLTAPAPPAVAANSYDSSMDAAFEQAAATYEADKSNYRLGGESPLAALSVTPIGKLWYTAWGICLLGCRDSDASQNARLLLPVLQGTKSAFVRDITFRALRSIHRLSQAALAPELHQQITDALAVQKMEVSA
jgi:hypothetical protein